MTVKTTLSFTDRHHLFLSEKVSEGVYATRSAKLIETILTHLAAREAHPRAPPPGAPAAQPRPAQHRPSR